MAIATIATRRAIKKLTVGPNSGTTQTMQKKNLHLWQHIIQKKTNIEEWIGDTGATCHMKSNTNGMYGLEKCKGIKIDTANGSTSIVTHIGNYKGKVQCSDGTELIIIMKNVKVIPGLVKNLFLLSTVMRNDWDLLTETTDDTKVLKIKKNDVEYKFDKKVSQNSNGGYLMGMQIVPDKIDEKEMKKTTKMTTKIKILKNEKKGMLAQKLAQRST